MIKDFAVIEKYLVLLLLFLLPTQLALHFWPPWAFVFGLRVDLLSPSIYLTDMLILLLVLMNTDVFSKFRKYFLIILTFGILNCVFSTDPPISVFRWLKVAEFSFIAIYFYQQQIVKTSTVVKTIFYSLILVSIIGILQFAMGGTIGGVLYFLGERSFNQSTPGIALVSLNGLEHLRAYSIFSHPNSLAGFLGAGILFILLSGKLKKKIFNFVGVLIILACFILSFSLSAYLGMFVAFSFYLFSKNKNVFKRIVNFSFLIFILGSLLFPLVSPWIFSNFPLIGQNISQRLDLAYISGQMIAQRFLIGEGLGAFITNMPTFKGVFIYSWLLQPVHNIYLLLMAETGAVGLSAFCYLVFRSLNTLLNKRKIYLIIPLVFILFTGLFDHYTITLQQNILLFSVFIGISFRVRIA